MANNVYPTLDSRCLKKTKLNSILLQLIFVVLVSLLSINCGLNFGWPSPSLLNLLSEDSEFKITEEATSYLVMLSPIAGCIGSPIGGTLIDKIGRKYTLLFLAITQIISWMLVGISSQVPLLFAGRILAGISDGILLSSLPVYICEILEPKLRGYFGSLPTFAIVLGSLLINTYGSFTTVRMAAYISIVFPLLFVIVFVAIPESPYYLLMNNRMEDAQKSLNKLRSLDQVEPELLQIYIDVRSQISEPGRLKHVFTIKVNLKTSLILVGLRIFQHLSGLSALNYYNQVIFKYANDDISPAMGSIICGIVRLISAGIGTFLIERCGRKSLMLWSMGLSSFSLILLGIYFYFHDSIKTPSLLMWIPIVIMLIYFLVNSAGVMIVPNLIMGEILSVQVKGVILSIVNICTGLFGGLSSKLFQFLEVQYGMYVSFLTFGICCVFGTLYSYFWVPETKGKTLGEIQRILKNKEVTDNDISYTTKL